MNRSHRAAHGSKSVPMDVAGTQRSWMQDGGHIATAIGNGRTRVGIGSVTNRGAGLAIIMEHGFMIQTHAGWCWVPGVEWAPAWVSWRMGGDYIGWAPCGPPGFVVEPSFFVFVESRHFHDHLRPDTVIVNNTTIIKNTTEIRNVRRENRQFDGKSQTVVVNEGPRVDVVEKATGHKFTVVSVQEADRKTSASVPEKFKHRPAKSAPNENPHAIQTQPNPTPSKNPGVPDDSPQKKKCLRKK